MTTSESHGAISGSRVSDQSMEALVHTQRAAARIIRERGAAMPGYHPSWADHMETVADALELLALRSEPSEPVAWQAIETAPEDGTPVWGITMEAQNPSPRIMWFQGERWLRVAKGEKFSPSGPHAWWPTHWQPIPASPQPGASS